LAFVDRVSANIEAKVSDPRWMEDYMDFYDELEAEREAAREEWRAECRTAQSQIHFGPSAAD
jgi:hypothetical protein